MQRFTLIYALLVGLSLLPACASLGSPVLDLRPGADWRVTNGTAFERGTVDIGTARTIVLPDNAVVRRCPPAGTVELYVAKTLGFMGHPSDRMSIRGARKEMGCAAMVDGDELLVATYGEWECIEGGAHIDLVALVPEGVAVQQRKGLSGRDSTLKGWDGRAAGAASNTRVEWKVVHTIPDPARTADTEKGSQE